MPRQRNHRRFIDGRNERIRQAASAGRSPSWIAQTFDVDLSTVYRACSGLDWSTFDVTEEPPAEWEAAVARGVDLARTPTDPWLDHLEDTDQSNAGSCVYFIQEAATRFVKIGVSTGKGVARRLAILQIGNPHALVIRRLVTGDLNVEAVLHAAFADSHVRGEWFEADDKLAEIGRLEL